MSKFKNKFRIESARLSEYDYTTPNWYYVTINTKNHIKYFGEVVDNKMIFSEIGKVVSKYWQDIPIHFSISELDYYVIMPNHIHGIIIINEINSLENKNLNEINSRIFAKPIKNSLSIIVNHFKGAVKRWCNKNGFEDFHWQPRFYDRIIRNEKELFRIRKYIEFNPLKWDIEKNQNENLDF
ncbi:Transposase [Ignavibacterium album JCM 16511]|uniref:Transposase n=1 Tax=Ignavibacterium album (strain DSM 19864 / JCM 16511 / NBRC 101810 / Mat9-16) TaxID=945713 RepID=I0AIP8_IGNAJ|nr:transposase [Ignavibacterium album]AFH48855.1 Transposase [Ignavibacterium album JCM 16511]